MQQHHCKQLQQHFPPQQSSAARDARRAASARRAALLLHPLPCIPSAWHASVRCLDRFYTLKRSHSAYRLRRRACWARSYPLTRSQPLCTCCPTRKYAQNQFNEPY
ncbi:hypothetical protein Rsub_13347 [Raphidocelis subcapitata]|uniref:Uncharacterized protein n=1 Tax=Raphidocelis subcapitata TaxID=307507 RepID=A0A2V0PT90_9CHLO|nr:hypothetical protein Rsub_13347 [Raphidocelis subcapitata]|eukprot:GBG00606.1 hypothetical protein Rsub_13347 [Raphidocelis subcapitata]